jgi:transcriptional regulator with XRE-family HTH domain
MDVVVDGELLARERIRSGLSRRALAGRAGVSYTLVRRLETSDETDYSVSLRLVNTLARCLGVDGGDLLRTPGGGDDNRPASDDVKVEAILVAAGRMVCRDDIARGLDWTLERTMGALKTLGERLEGTGQRLRQGQFGWWGIVPHEPVLTRVEARHAARAQMADHGMNLQQARALYALVVAARDDNAKARRRGEFLLRHWQARTLIGADLVEMVEGEPQLHPDVMFSLGLAPATRPPLGSRPAGRVRRPKHGLQ